MAHQSNRGPKPQDGSITIITKRPSSEADRVCSYCDEPLPLVDGAGSLAVCECPRCQRLVKPRLRSTLERAIKFRESLRLLVRIKTAPHALTQQVLADLDRQVWTSLTGIDGEPFTTFEAFCSDPKGLGCDAAVVKALLEKLKGKNAVALLTVPASRQGRRTDRAAGTSRRRGEKSRTPRTDTRLRKIAQSPQIGAAHARGLVGRMDADQLAAYARERPDCSTLLAICSDLDSGPPKGSSELVNFKRGISARIRDLISMRPSLEASRRVQPPLLPFGVGLPDSDGEQANLIDDLSEAPQLGQLESSHGATTAPTTTPNTDAPAADLSAEDTHPPVGKVGALEAKEALVELLRAWRRLIQVCGDDLPMTIWLEVLDDVSSGRKQPEDEELHTRVSLHRRAQQLATALGSDFAEYDQLRYMAMGDRDWDAELLQRAEDALASCQGDGRRKKPRRRAVRA